VPGCVDGWIALNTRFGTLPLPRTLSPAIEAARTGFPVSTELASTLERIRGLVGEQPSAAELYPRGSIPSVGTAITRPSFADTLEGIATEGRAGMYDHDVAAGIIAASDGAITPDDLARDQADWIEPASLDVMGRTGWTIPPNSQGYLTLAALWIFEALDPPDDPNDPVYQHLLIESYRAVAWERAITVADADHAPQGADDLLAPSRLAARAEHIQRDTVTRWPRPQPAPGGTAYMTVLDGDGMGISLIQSNFAGIGSGLSAGSTGVWLHNRGAGFNLLPGHPNEYAPGKRPLHTLSPTLWTVDGHLAMLLGTRGGDQQPQYLAQYAAHHLMGGLCVDDAQAHPRWFMDQPLPGTDSALRVESRMAPGTMEGLRLRGHQIDIAGPHEPGWGPISAIDVIGPRIGAADPRVSTSAAVTT
jgi:gamma-glutamyltranspeptidase/glutathione hydrolase